MRDGKKTKERIKIEALRLFAAKGVEGTSVRDIAAAVGIAEGALYRHFASKDALARTIFLNGYAALAQKVVSEASPAKRFGRIVVDIVAVFCALFDEDRSLFSFLLLSQHAHLPNVPLSPHENVVSAVRKIFTDAMTRGEIPPQNADELTAIALGVVAQPAIFTLYGSLEGPLLERASRLSATVLAAASGQSDPLLSK